MYFLLHWREIIVWETDTDALSANTAVDQQSDQDGDYLWDETLENQLTEEYEEMGGIMEESVEQSNLHYYL